MSLVLNTLEHNLQVNSSSNGMFSVRIRIPKCSSLSESLLNNTYKLFIKIQRHSHVNCKEDFVEQYLQLYLYSKANSFIKMYLNSHVGFVRLILFNNT